MVYLRSYLRQCTKRKTSKFFTWCLANGSPG